MPELLSHQKHNWLVYSRYQTVSCITFYVVGSFYNCFAVRSFPLIIFHRNCSSTIDPRYSSNKYSVSVYRYNLIWLQISLVFQLNQLSLRLCDISARGCSTATWAVCGRRSGRTNYTSKPTTRWHFCCSLELGCCDVWSLLPLLWRRRQRRQEFSKLFLERPRLGVVHRYISNSDPSLSVIAAYTLQLPVGSCCAAACRLVIDAHLAYSCQDTLPYSILLNIN